MNEILHGYSIEDTPEQACSKCDRQGVVSHPWLLGDPLDISVMIVGQNPGFPDDGKPNPHVAFFGYSFTCDVIMRVVAGSKGIYLTNVVKCAHEKECTRGQIKKCSDLFLEYELAFFDPCLIITVGNVADDTVRRLAPDFENRVTKVVHPGYIRRMGWSPDEIDVWCDDLYNLISRAGGSKYDN